MIVDSSPTGDWAGGIIVCWEDMTSGGCGPNQSFVVDGDDGGGRRLLQSLRYQD